MSEFSKEYLNAIGSSWKPDFSYINELLVMKDGAVFERICEGFGSIGAILISGEPYLLFHGSDPVKIFNAIENLRSNQKTRYLNLFN